jgi:hypothetical protein
VIKLMRERVGLSSRPPRHAGDALDGLVAGGGVGGVPLKTAIAW